MSTSGGVRTPGAIRRRRVAGAQGDGGSPPPHLAFEEYCEAIYELREDDVDVIQARIADRIGVSRPAVSEMIRRMETEGLVSPSPRAPRSPRRAWRWPRGRAPPPPGRALPDRHPRALLGRGPHRGRRWEHVLSDRSRRPSTASSATPPPAPRQPDPRVHYREPDTVALSDVEVGPDFIGRRIPEELEFTPGCSSSSRVVASSPVATAPHGVVARRHRHREHRRAQRRHRRLRQHPHPRRTADAADRPRYLRRGGPPAHTPVPPRRVPDRVRSTSVAGARARPVGQDGPPPGRRG